MACLTTTNVFTVMSAKSYHVLVNTGLNLVSSSGTTHSTTTMSCLKVMSLNASFMSHVRRQMLTL